MKKYEAKDIRNLALVGHKGAGKTSLAEAFLFDGKATTRLGSVDNKTSTFSLQPRHLSYFLISGFTDIARKVLDEGVDLFVTKDGRQSIVQVKRYSGTVGQPVVLGHQMVGKVEQTGDEDPFVLVTDGLAKAIAELDQLMTAKPALLEQALLAGTLALDNGEPEAATGFFETALAIDDGNQQALAGIRRAENLPQVLHLPDPCIQC
mgnify:CR=1 FL=1